MDFLDGKVFWIPVEILLGTFPKREVLVLGIYMEHLRGENSITP